MVFGAGGQIGHQLIESCALAGCAAVGLTRTEADICAPAAVAEAIGRHAPTIIVNAAAYTAVDQAESDTEQAFAVNRDGAAVLAQAAATAGLPLIHLSTDYVFDGQGRTPYREDDPVRPQGAYARSKAAGERAVRDAHDRHLILRTSWVYGPFGTNFLRTMLRFGAERDELAIIDDQTGCPTATADIAAAIIAMAVSAERGDFTAWGTYHYAGADAVTWHGFATLIFAEAAKFGRKSPRLRPIATADYPTTAPRPAYSVLSSEKIRRSFGVEPRPLHDSLVASLRRLLDKPL